MSPNKTLYIRDADAEVWNRAETIAKSRGTSVSQLATDGLRATLPPVNPADDPGMEEIRVEVGTDERHHEEAFIGRWLVPYGEDSRTDEKTHISAACWGVALTKRGKFAVYMSPLYGEPGILDAYDTLDEAAADGHPADILAEAAAELGQSRPIWRDI